jgi:formylglycine-generating enzyme required for sulfatase activity/serine/threonine protein kinase
MPPHPLPDETPRPFGGALRLPGDTDSLQPTAAGPLAARGGLGLMAGQRPLPEYVLVRVLGRGGFGEGEAGRIELRSLELMRSIRHANLLPMFGAWQQEGRLIIAMELADGNLLDRLRHAQNEGQPGIPADELLQYLRDAARGLDFLNQCRDPLGASDAVGIQHKDVKPQNLLLVGGAVKVADFDLVRVLEHTIDNATGSLTPAYAAPEFFHDRVTRWSDQYCLAVTYCQLRGGRLPFQGNHAQIMYKVLTEPPDLGMLPPAERPAVGRALSKNARERWPSCREFVEALAATPSKPAPVVVEPLPPERTPPAPSLPPFLSPELHAVAPPPVVKEEVKPPPARKAEAEPAPPPKPREAPRPPRARRPAPRHRLPSWLALLGVGAAAFAGTGVVLLLTRLPDRPQPKKATEAVKVAPGPRGDRPREESTRPPATDNGKDKKEKAVPPGPVPEPPPLSAQGPPELPPGPQPVERFTSSIGMQLVWVRPGTFLMGSPNGKRPPGVPAEEKRDEDETPHPVTLTRGFYMSAHLVTQYQWEQVMGSNPSAVPGPTDAEKKQRPVDGVSWDDCRRFCAELSRREGWTYRLPSEAQWEYACRAGTSTAFWWGSSITTEQANYDGRMAFGPAGRAGVFRNKPTPVAAFPANPWGLYDMHGNLWQWCEDLYRPYSGHPAVDPLITEGQSRQPRVLRGGCWRNGPSFCRSAARSSGMPDSQDRYRGCRVIVCPD